MPERMLDLFLTTFHFPTSSVNYGVRQYRLKPREGIGPQQVCRLAERPLSLRSCRLLKMSGRQVFRQGGIADGKVCYGQESISPARGERIVSLPGRKWKSADGPHIVRLARYYRRVSSESQTQPSLRQFIQAIVDSSMEQGFSRAQNLKSEGGALVKAAKPLFSRTRERRRAAA